MCLNLSHFSRIEPFYKKWRQELDTFDRNFFGSFLILQPKTPSSHGRLPLFLRLPQVFANKNAERVCNHKLKFAIGRTILASHPGAFLSIRSNSRSIRARGIALVYLLLMMPAISSGVAKLPGIGKLGMRHERKKLYHLRLDSFHTHDRYRHDGGVPRLQNELVQALGSL